MDEIARIYVSTYGNYSEGNLDGKWITLPMDEDDLRAELADAIFGNDPEFMIQDYEGFGLISGSLLNRAFGESANIIEMNELFNELVSAERVEEFFALVESDSIEAARDSWENAELYENRTLEELVSEWIEDGVFSVETLLNYIDTEALARDVSFDGYNETSFGVLAPR